MRYLTVSLFIFLYIPFCHAQVELEKHLFIEQGDTLPYRLLYPVNYNAAMQYPLVLFLHGSGARGNDNTLQLTNVPDVFTDTGNRAKYPCFLLVPQCGKNDVWVNFPDFPKSLSATDTPTTAARLALALVSNMTANLPIDTNRIYITGYSMGGEGTFDLISRKPGLFAAAAPVCPVADTAKASLIKQVSIWTFHGAKDKVNDVLYSRIMIDALKKAGGQPRYTEYNDAGHRVWDKAYAEPELLEWMFSQRK